MHCNRHHYTRRNSRVVFVRLANTTLHTCWMRRWQSGQCRQRALGHSSPPMWNQGLGKRGASSVITDSRNSNVPSLPCKHVGSIYVRVWVMSRARIQKQAAQVRLKFNSDHSDQITHRAVHVLVDAPLRRHPRHVTGAWEALRECNCQFSICDEMQLLSAIECDCVQTGIKLSPSCHVTD